MLQKTRGIVLHSLKYSESSQIMHLYTLDFGRQSYLIRGIRKSHSRNRMALYHPLSILNLEVSHSAQRDLQHIREASVSVPLGGITGNPVKETVALFMAEVLYRTLREQESNPSLFLFLENTILLLDMSAEEFPNLHLYFLVQLTRYLGFYPENNFDRSSPCFDLLAGRFTEGPPVPGQVLSPELSAGISVLLQADLSALKNIPLRGQDRSLLAGCLIDFYHFHLEGMGSIKTLEIMREIFSR